MFASEWDTCIGDSHKPYYNKKMGVSGTRAHATYKYTHKHADIRNIFTKSWRFIDTFSWERFKRGNAAVPLLSGVLLVKSMLMLMNQFPGGCCTFLKISS